MSRPVLLGAVIALLAIPAVASATSITVGSDLSRAGTPNWCTGDGPGTTCTLLQLTLGIVDQAVPADGVITSWSVRGASGQLALRVLDGAPGQRRVVATGPPVTAGGSDVQSFPAQLPVHAGQRIAVELGADAQLPMIYRDEQTTGERYDPPLTADPAPPDPSADVNRGYELLYNATIQTAVACPSAGVIARGSDSLVFRDGRRLFGCRAGQRTPIGRRSSSTRFRLFRFNGNELALVRVSSGRSAIQIFDLMQRRRIFSTTRTFDGGPAHTWTVTALVVAPNGNAAWIARPRGEPRRTTVWIHFANRVKQIDQGAIRPTSLRLTPDATSVEYTGADGRERQSGFD